MSDQSIVPSVEVGIKLKDKHVTQHLAAAQTTLIGPERVVALFWARKISPLIDAVVITDARVLGVSQGNVTKSVTGSDIVEAVIEKGKLGSLKLRLRTTTGVVEDFGDIKTEDSAAIARHTSVVVGATGEAATAHAEAAQVQSAAEDALMAVIVGRVGKKALEEVRNSCRPGEAPVFVLGSGTAGTLAAFDDRCLIIKKGAMTGLMAGALGGGRVSTFMYGDITGIEYNSGFVNGVLEILTPSYHGTANKDFWRGTDKGRNQDSNDPWTLSNCLPLSKLEYAAARTHIDQLKQMVADVKRPVIHTAPAPPASTDLAGEIAKLAELHQQGILEADEFRAAKAALIAQQ